MTTIAAEAGVDVSNLHRALRREGIPTRGRAGSPAWGDILTKDYLERQLRASRPIRSIAEEVGCDPVVVRRWILTHNLEPIDVSRTLKRDLTRMYVREHQSIKAIAAHYTVSPTRARAMLVAAGITIRDRGRPPSP
ncbi:MAG: hypothetical protein M3469_00570 [Actinomycetota bacterium]|nr:hypothetical protein [Actinomycetota bacterium]